jgi:hypothetical protein
MSSTVAWPNAAVCTGLYTTTQANLRNVACGEVFCMFMVFLISQLLYAFKYAGAEEAPDQGSNPDAPPAPAEDSKKWNNKEWKEEFLALFAVHLMALSLAATFRPVVADALGWIHFFFFLIFVIVRFCKGSAEKGTIDNFINIGTQGSMAVCNVGLLIAAAAGLPFNNCE